MINEESDGTDPVAVAVAALLAAWFWTAAANNVPAKGFDRVRKRVTQMSLWIPNWRFFAPNPLQHDNHILFRLRTADGIVTGWSELELMPARSWWNVVVYPGKRRLKAINDVVTVVLENMRNYPIRYVQGGAHFRTLEEFVRHGIDLQHTGSIPEGYQWALVRYSGYDDRTEPDYQIVSAYQPFERPVVSS